MTKTIMDTHVRDNLAALRDLNPMGMIHNSALQSIVTGAFPTFQNLTSLNTSDFDNDTMVDTANNRLLIKTAGKFMIGFSVQFAANATGDRGGRVMINAGAITPLTTTQRADATGNTNINGSALWNCAVNDAITLQAAQDSGGALNVNASGAYLWAYRVAA